MNKKDYLKKMTPLILVSLLLLFTNLAWYNLRNIFPNLNASINIGESDMSLLMSIFGWSALPGYFIGGWLTEKFNAKWLLILAAFLVAGTGLWWTTISLGINNWDNKPIRMAQLYIIYGSWGAIEGFIFFAAFTKVVSQLTHKDDQMGIWAKAVCFVAITAAVMILGIGYPIKALNLVAVINGHRINLGIPLLMAISSISLIIAGLCIWYYVDFDKNKAKKKGTVSNKDIVEIIKNPRVWMMAFTILGVSLVTQTSPFFTHIISKNLGVSKTIIIPFTTFATYGDVILMTPFILIIGKKIKSYLKALVIVGMSFIATATIAIFIPFARSFGVSSVLLGVFVLIFYKITGFIKPFFWSLRWSQIQELNVKKSQYGLVVGTFSVLAFSSEGWYQLVSSSVQSKFKGADGKTTTLQGNQIVIGIALGIAFLCFLSGLILFLYNRKLYIARGRDTYRIIDESSGYVMTPSSDNEDYSNNEDEASQEIFNFMGGKDNVAKIIWCSTKLTCYLKDNDKVDKDKMDVLFKNKYKISEEGLNIVMGSKSKKIGQKMKEKIEE